MSYLKANWGLRRVNLGMAIASLLFVGITAACTESANTDAADTGWSAAEYREGREAFFDGYGTPDAFGECSFDWIIDHYTSGEIKRAAQDDDAIEEIIDDATDACEHLL